MMSMLHVASFVTDFADEAVIWPSAAAVAVALALAGWTRGAISWVCIIAGALLATLALKLLFGACGYLIGTEIRSPSGHTAAAGAFYGSLLAFVVRRSSNSRLLAALSILAVVAVVGASRVVLGAHTIAEVVIGAAIGIGAATMFLRFADQPPGPPSRLAAFLMPTILVIILFHGIRMPAEAAIRAVASDFWPLSVCRAV